MKRYVLLLLSVMALGTTVWAQTERYPIFTYGEDTVYNDEFMRVFMKNKPEGYVPSKSEIDDYLELYIKFKLKVKEAYERQMDTSESFKSELAGYRKQLAQPYLTDKSVNDQLIEEAYYRMGYEINASHILILCPFDASPEDSMKAFQKVLGLRNRIVSKGEDFGAVAEAYSEDPSAKSNQGSLGYFTAFQMIYDFESAAYSLEVGDVSMPIRTQYGYHLIKLNDKRRTIGDIQVAHIMINVINEEASAAAKLKIDAVYQKLLAGASWESMVSEFSEDYRSAANDGKLNYFNRTTPNVPVEFKDQAFDLTENGQFSAPFRTKFGWHIIMRTDLKPMRSFDELKSQIARKVERDSRSELNKSVVLERIKVENGFKQLLSANDIVSYFDTTLKDGKYRMSQDVLIKGKEVVLFMIGDRSYTLNQFGMYLEEKVKQKSRRSLLYTLQQYLDSYISEENFKYEDEHLEEKYEEFRFIMQEYKDGILLFELTEQEVWSKAHKDSAGLANFYAANADRYMLNERAEVVFLSFKDKRFAKKGRKLLKKHSPEVVDSILNAEDVIAVTKRSATLDKGSKEFDGVEWKEGLHQLEDENGRIKYVLIKAIHKKSVKPLNQNMGQATSDYQDELEKLWINGLRQKYPVSVMADNLSRLYK